jgi:hypothetical protein
VNALDALVVFAVSFASVVLGTTVNVCPRLTRDPIRMAALRVSDWYFMTCLTEGEYWRGIYSDQCGAKPTLTLSEFNPREN